VKLSTSLLRSFILMHFKEWISPPKVTFFQESQPPPSAESLQEPHPPTAAEPSNCLLKNSLNLTLFAPKNAGFFFIFSGAKMLVSGRVSSSFDPQSVPLTLPFAGMFHHLFLLPIHIQAQTQTSFKPLRW